MAFGTTEFHDCHSKQGLGAVSKPPAPIMGLDPGCHSFFAGGVCDSGITLTDYRPCVPVNAQGIPRAKFKFAPRLSLANFVFTIAGGGAAWVGGDFIQTGGIVTFDSCSAGVSGPCRYRRAVSYDTVLLGVKV